MNSRIKKALNNFGRRFSEDHLIDFDYKVILLILISIIFFVSLVTFKINGSSIGSWSRIVPDIDVNKSVLLGEAKWSRSDEWASVTPFILSQIKNGFPVENEDVGAGKSVLFLGLPAAHFITIFRPQLWGYFFLDAERGFSYWWNFKVFGLGLSSFFLFLLLTRNRFWLSLLGAAWLFFSGYTQWWLSTTLPEMTTSIFVAFIAFAYLFLAKRITLALVAAVLLIISSINFILVFYPPFQITSAYLAVFLAVGFILSGARRQACVRNLFKRLPLAGGAVGAALAVLLLFYLDTRETINIITGTIYPGHRVTQGGEFPLVRIFSGFTGAPYDEQTFPANWANACEASKYILLFPVIMLAWARSFVLKIKNNPIITALLLYLFLMSAWALVQFPIPFAKLTLMGYVPSYRTALGLGLASIIVTIVYLSMDEKKDGIAADRRFVWGASLLAMSLLTLYGLMFKQATGDFLQYRYIALFVIFFSAVSWLLLSRKRAAFSALILVSLTPNFLVNPIAHGLSPIFENHISRFAAEIHSQKPDAKWIAYDDWTIAQLLKANGLNVINGSAYAPNLNKFSYLDPGMNNAAVYNRSGHLTFLEQQAGSSKKVEFVLRNEDDYLVKINPCSEKLKKLGIDYFLFAHTPNQESLKCLNLVAGSPETGYPIYERKK